MNDEGYLKKLAESRRAITGRDSKKPHKQLHLFCGPPATGKTLTMKILAAEGGLSARLFLNLKLFFKKNYVLLQWVASVKIAFSLRGLKAFQLMLSEPGYGTLKEMQDALKRIDE